MKIDKIVYELEEIIDRDSRSKIRIIPYDKTLKCTLYCMKDVASFLGYSRPKVSVYRRCKRRVMRNCIVRSKNRSADFDIIAKMIFTDQKGVYYFISSIRMPLYKRMKLIDVLGLDKSKVYLRSEKEVSFFDKLESALNPFGIFGIRQYKVLGYRIDYYIPELKLAIEYDEDGHRYYNHKSEKVRQDRICNYLDCKMYRISDDNSDETNLGIVLNYISELSVRDDNGFIVLEEAGDLAKQAKEWYKKHQAV